jgi:WD40 repeat protein
MLKGHLGIIKAMAFLPNGNLVVSMSSDKTVRLWDLATGATCSMLKGYLDLVRAMAFSPNSNLVASVSLDEMVRL